MADERITQQQEKASEGHQVRPHPASFRDPSGFVFEQDGQLYRQVNRSYQADYDHLMGSGLYEALRERNWIVPHEEVALPAAAVKDAYRVVRPVTLPFISYPYEWSFGQLKDAALLTLQLMALALDHGMVLKDASAYNIQFWQGRPILLDTLSFEWYRVGEPWVAYRQFCQHFLAPLALMHYRDGRLGQLLRLHLDGVPLDLAVTLLPCRAWLSLGLFMHLYLQNRNQQSATQQAKNGRAPYTETAMRGLVDNLESTVRGLHWQPDQTAWASYYDSLDHYSEAAVAAKVAGVERFLSELAPRLVWDLGANTGLYSRLASQQGAFTVAFDYDPGAVELHYHEAKKNNLTQVLPLVLDLTNPSPSQGWAHRERDALLARGPADVVLALALVHHLAIANNVPLQRLAEFCYQAGRALIVEFVPKTDPKVQLLLANRRDIFDEYDEAHFEAAFAPFFEQISRQPLAESGHSLYLFRRRDS